MGNKLNVKPGDKVLYTSRYEESIETVKSITPSGNIRIEDGPLFTPEGRLKSSDPYAYAYISIITDDDRKRLKMKRVLNKVSRFKDWSSLSEEDLITIYNIINK